MTVGSFESEASDFMSSQQQLQRQGALEVAAMVMPESNFSWGGVLDQQTMASVSSSNCPHLPALTPSDAYCSADFELMQMELTAPSIALRFSSPSTESSSSIPSTPFMACSARSMTAWLFTPHWTHLQCLFKVTRTGLLYAPSFAGVPNGSLLSCTAETCRVEFSNEVLFALGWLTDRLKEFTKSTASYCPGWMIRNNTDKVNPYAYQLSWL
ncbi:unnamed protein product [Dibothriocephalus latus]|uniref:Uncharacterized protein n=1 Tax=Dibothriocephalus latus TaxID=60516 RepID=A0A3P7MPE0_DIBLA|nr:unnamed protein product [Dibothriocephalus latus]